MFSKETFRYAKEISAIRETADLPWLAMEPMESVRALEAHLKKRLMKDFFLSDSDANKVIGQIKQKFTRLSNRREAFLMMNAFIDVQIAEYNEAQERAEAEGTSLAALTEKDRKERRSKAKKFFEGFRTKKRAG